MPEPENAGMKEGGIASWSHMVLFDLFLLSFLILSARLATLLHEVLGHGLTAAALGGTVNGIRISLFGGGNAYYRFGHELGPAPLFAVSFGGILINLLTGVFALALANSSRMQGGRRLFLSVFGIISLCGGIAYSCLGFYYGVGDPAASLRDPSQAGSWLWVSFLAGALVAAYAGVRVFLRSVQAWFPVKGFAGKLLVLALTLGITIAVYALLYLSTRQRSVALETPQIAEFKAEEKIRDEKKAVEAHHLRESHPDWTEEELIRAAEKIIVHVHPEEIPRKPPLIPALALAYVVGTLLALRADKQAPVLRPPVSVFLTLAMLAFAASTLALIAATGGWVWRAAF